MQRHMKAPPYIPGLATFDGASLRGYCWHALEASFHPRRPRINYEIVSTFTETTAQITVQVEPTPLVEESSPAESSYVFAYAIRIENKSDATVQLLERHWFVESAGEQINEVQGPGVVGVQPILEPGGTFEYTSSTVIRDPVGAMYGTYIFSRKTGGFFTVQIPRFKLLYPMMFN